MKTDDDAFVRIDEVVSSLKEKPSRGLLYGLIASKSSPQRDEGSKWYVSEEVIIIILVLINYITIFPTQIYLNY